MGELLRDIRFAVRVLRGSPTFALVAVLTISLGVGADTAIFSIVEAVLLRPLPYADADRLVVLGGQLRGVGTQDLTASAAEFRDYTDRANTLESLAAAWAIDANLTSGVEPERVRAQAATWNLFEVLGSTPILGRDFTAEDAAGEIGIGYVAILSFDAWQRLFQGDPGAIGQTIRLDDDPMTVIGVMPRDFEHPGESQVDRTSLWVTVNVPPGSRFDRRSFRPFTLIGRLIEGASLESARAEFASIAADLRGEYPDFYPEESGWTVQVEPLRERIVGDVRAALLIVFTAVGLVLLAACANVATLLLARGQGRSRELAIRVALGGGRGRLVRQLLTESLVLGVAGGALGLGMALAGLRLLHGHLVTALPRAGIPGLGISAFVYALLVSLVACAAFGLFPALEASRLQPQELLREDRGGSRGQNRARNAMAAIQVAVSLVLVVGAGLLTRSLVYLLETDPGFDQDGVLVVQTWLPIPNDPAEGRFMTLPDRVGFVERVLDLYWANPAVTDAAMTSLLPLRGLQGREFLIDGEERTRGEALPSAEFRQVSPSYFKVMGIPLLQGRMFVDGDDANSPRVLVVDRRMADQFLDGNPIGRQLRFGPGAPWEVVGVVGDVRDEVLDAVDRPHIYVSFRQNVGLSISFVLKTVGEPEALAGFVRESVRRVDPDQPVFGVSTMGGVVAETLGRERLLATLFRMFAGLGLSLAAVGIYGVVAYAARQRRREIGIRLAMGASVEDVLRLVVRDALVVSGLGIAVGLMVAGATSGVLSTVLYGVDGLDPGAYAGAAAVSVAVAVSASLLPAWGATQVHPVESMRSGSG